MSQLNLNWCVCSLVYCLIFVDVLDVLAGGETLVEISRAGLSLLSMVTVKQVFLFYASARFAFCLAMAMGASTR